MENNIDEKEMYKDFIVDYLNNKGINIKKRFSCLNPDHTDIHPSMGYNKKGKHVKCFACNANYDIYELVKIDYKLSNFNEAYEKVKELYGVKNVNSFVQSINKEIVTNEVSKDYSNYFDKVSKFVDYTDYFDKRGLSKRVIQLFNIGFDAQYYTIDNEKNYWRAMIIPTSQYSFVARNTDPDAKKENRYRKVGKSNFLNINILDKTDEPIFIVEGEIDALSIIECGAHAISLGSISNIRSFIDYIKPRKILNTFILALDNDDTGRKATIELENELEKNEFKSSRFIFSNDYKDINQFLVENKELLKAKVDETIEECKPLNSNNEESYSDISATETAKKLVEKLKEGYVNQGISTGFQNLDIFLDGGVYEGLYIIGAISAIGKTSFILQITDYFARLNNEVLYFSLEMSSTELVAKSLSRNSFKIANLEKGYTTRDILSGKIPMNDLEDNDSIFNKSVVEYLSYSNRVKIIQGIGNIGLKNIQYYAENHMSNFGKKPIIIIDYLQIIAPYNERYSDKQNMDKAVLELKRLSRDLGVTVICISSFNRQNYDNKPSMQSFKESGAIEYSADVLLGISENSPNSKSKKEKSDEDFLVIKELKIEVLKNRNGETGSSNLKYYPAYNYFEEEKV